MLFFITLFSGVMPAAVLAFAQGGGVLSLFNRYTRQNSPPLSSSSLNESLSRLDLYQSAPGYGGLFSSSDYSRTDLSPGDADSSLSRFQLGLEGFRLGEWTTTFIAGDMNVRFTDLVEGFPGPYYSLLALRPFSVSPFSPEAGRFLNTNYPDIYFRGGALNSVSGQDSLLLFGGRLASTKGFQSNQFDFSGENLYGAKWTHQWSPDFYTGFGIAQTYDQPRTLNTSQATVNNTVLLLDGSYRLNDHLKLVGEYKENLFRQQGGEIADLAVKIGPVVTLPKLAFEANYRYTGADFIYFSDNLNPEQDTEGLFASADYKPLDSVALNTSIDWSRNNLRNSHAFSALDSLSASIGSYFFLPPLPSLGLRFSVIDRQSRQESSIPLSAKSYTVSLDAAKQFKTVTPYLRLQGDLGDDKIAPENSSTAGSAVLGVRVSPASNLNFYLEGEDQVRSVDNGTTTDSFNARGGMSLVPRAGLNLYADASYSNTKDQPAGTQVVSVSAGSGANITLPAQFYLNGDLRYGSSRTSGSNTGEFSNLQITVGLGKRFGWGTRSASLLPGQAGTMTLTEVGDIEGDVFLDLNQDGVKDITEPGVRGMTVFLEDGRKAVTGADGHYRFSDVAIGIHQVSLNERELPASYNLLAVASRRIEVSLRGTIKVAYPLLLSGSIKGRVLIDLNKNGAADQGDAPLPDMLIYLAGTQLNTYSDSDGNFAIENLLPGKYQVKIDQSGLAERMKLVSPDTVTVEVTSGAEVTGLSFLAAAEEREVIKKVFGSPKPPETVTPERGAKPAAPAKPAKPAK